MGKINETRHKKRPQSVGQKKPFSLEQVQLIRANLQAIGNLKRTALFETALSTMLRACDVLDLRVHNVRDATGSIVSEFYVKQEKTNDTVKCFLGHRAQAALAEWIAHMNHGVPAHSDRRLFVFTRQHYGRIVKEWAELAHLDPLQYSTHTMRRSSAAHIYRKTKNIEAIRQLLGHANLSHTQAYLGVSQDEAAELAHEHRL